MTPAERLDALGRIINKQLAKSGVPPVSVVPANLGPGGGLFKFRTWDLEIDQGVLNSPLTPTVADTVYHEGRHAEQWYNAAQSRAASGANGQQISTDTGIRPDVANTAGTNPLPPNSSPNAVLGQAVNGSVYDPVRGRQRGTILRTLTTNPGDTNNYDRYRALPEEIDAWRTGEATGGCL